MVGGLVLVEGRIHSCMAKMRNVLKEPVRTCGPTLGVVGWVMLLVVMVLSACGKAAEIPSSTATPAPTAGPFLEFTVLDLEEQEVHLSDLRGNVVLVNFWASWCSPCREEMPILQEYYLEHKEENFVLVGVNVSDRPERVAELVAENGYQFPIWLDPPGNVLIDLRMQGLPASLLIDAEGHLINRWIGPVAEGSLDVIVGPYVGGGDGS
jgi:cytochrome c biogenesis protein CcmG/thiol:disulfide interchange protein DsbE